MTMLTVAACQVSATPDPAENLATISSAAAEAARRGARLAVFPEATMACFGTDLGRVAEPLDGPFADGVRQIASQHDLTLVVGMFEPADPGRVHNTLLVTGGGVETSYRKIHLYDAFGNKESDHVAPGSEHVTFTLRAGEDDVCIGVATCYDVRFADQFSALGRSGAQLIALPASWADGPGKAEQWDLLLRSRAMDAQAWLLAADQPWRAPKGNAALGIGRSALIDPLGGVRARLDHRKDVLVERIDLDVVADVRARVPVL